MNSYMHIMTLKKEAMNFEREQETMYEIGEREGRNMVNVLQSQKQNNLKSKVNWN